MRRAAIAISTALIAASTLHAGASGAEDRYGPQTPTSLADVQPAADTPLLTWPGKRAAPDAAPAPEMAPAPAPMPAPPPPAPRAAARPVIAPAPPVAPVSLYTPPPRPAPPPPAPTPPPPSPQVARAVAPAAPPPPVSAPPANAAPAAQASAMARPWSASGNGLPPHIYSVARQYGLQPDPDPAPDPGATSTQLPAQFFAPQPGSDLAAPPPPLPPTPIPGSQTVSSTAAANTPANRARSIALQTASPDGDQTTTLGGD